MTDRKGAHLGVDHAALVINQLSIEDKDVVREAQRWTTGERGEVVDDPQVLVEADLSEFVSEAVKIGAHALSATGQSQDARAAQLDRIDDIKKAAGSIHKNADKIETGCTAVTSAINRLLSEALAALADAQSATAATDTSSDAVA